MQGPQSLVREEETEAQRGTCPRLPGWELAELNLTQVHPTPGSALPQHPARTR